MHTMNNIASNSVVEPSSITPANSEHKLDVSTPGTSPDKQDGLRRLRVSKVKMIDEAKTSGQAVGRRWAEDYAEYDELA